MSNNFEVLNEAKKRFAHLSEPNSGWYYNYGFHAMAERRPIVAASFLGKWFMMDYENRYKKPCETLGQVRTFLAKYYRTGEEPDDRKLKDYMIAMWGEKNHREIEYHSDAKLRKLLQFHMHQNLKPGQFDYFEYYQKLGVKC